MGIYKLAEGDETSAVKDVISLIPYNQWEMKCEHQSRKK